ncbi:hypothetical protein BDN72DRAFT_835932 [Pluteus cervinus]|uniref:Uncharacterized protein n=1 Tax=Pluteus cervinus TaxID=181527 RepID=A0ACD3B3N7_9AGAR|nr:hypothetical protein BDN72DRAFT_835932 [Pluteus cervinus]
MPSELEIGLGVLLMGSLFAMALWGVTCVQVYTYFTRSSSDRLILKATITFLLVLITFDRALLNYILYFYLIKQFGNPLTLWVVNWSNFAHDTIRPVVGFIVRTMFIHRVYIFSNKSILLASWIMVFSFTGLVTGVLLQLSGFFGPDAIADGLIYSNLGAVTLANLSITTSLCYLLHRSKTGFRRTNSIVQVLIIYTVGTGGLVTLGSLLTVVGAVFASRAPDQAAPVPAAIVDCITRILNGMYLSSYLAGLNAREAIRDQFNDPISVRSQLGLPMTFAPGTSAPQA